MIKTKEERFLTHVDKTGDCWFWTAGKTPNGYGMFSMGKRSEGSRHAHRVAYELWKGPIEDGKWVLHTCRNKCVNPDHLVLGTPSTNNKDDKARDNTLMIGEKNPSSKYTEEQIRNIRERYESGETQTSISLSTGIRQGHISDICLRKIWNHI